MIAAGVGYLIYFTLLDRIGPIQINLIGYVAQVFAAACGWLLFGESLTLTTVIGFGVITIGFAIAKHEQLRDEIERCVPVRE